MPLDRAYQKTLLQELARLYPAHGKMPKPDNSEDEKRLGSNLAYLEEHGLVEVVWSETWDGPKKPINARATALGMDFLEDDGGLTAILGVVTIRLEEETVKQLLMAKVDASDAPETVKAKLKAQIKALPAEGLKEATMELLKAGMQNVPQALQWIQGIVGG